MEGLYSDVIFKGFYQAYDESLVSNTAGGGINARNSSNTNAFNADLYGN